MSSRSLPLWLATRTFLLDPSACLSTTPHDPKTGAYALGPRMYDPQINRFVGSDFYAGAGANMDLALDPLTGNRYLYAGANPTGMIDDGHAYLYSSRWHPTKWRVWSQFSGRVSWNFDTWGVYNQYKNGYDTYHRVHAKLEGRTVTYIKIDEGQWGRNDQKWAQLNAEIVGACQKFCVSGVI